MAIVDFEAGFDAYYASHQKTWKHDRSKSVGASEVFGCIRKAWFAKHKTARDEDYDDSWGALERGNIIEDFYLAPRITWILDNMTERGRLNYAGQANQKTFIDKASSLSVTPDGLVSGVEDDALAKYGVPSLGGTGCFNLEFKSIDPRVNLKEEKAVHRGQVNVQMGMTREQTRFRPNYAVILYVDASFLSEIDIFVVPFEQRIYDAAKVRARVVFDTADPGELTPEGKLDGDCKFCPFRGACADATQSITPTRTKEKTNTDDLPDELKREFYKLVAAEREASSVVKDVEKEAAATKEDLKVFMRELGQPKLTDGELTVSLFFQQGRKTLDLNAMKEDGVDLDKYYKRGPGFDVLRVSEKGAKTAEEQ